MARRRKEVREVMAPSLRALAAVLGCGLTTVRRYAARGLVVAAPDGSGFDVNRTRAAVARARRRGELGTAALGRPANAALREAKARLTEERARIAGLQRQRMEAELVELSAAQAAWAAEIERARTRLSRIPAEWRRRCPDVPRAAADLVAGLIAEALAELRPLDFAGIAEGEP